MTIPTMTTTAIKFGAYVTVWVIFKRAVFDLIQSQCQDDRQRKTDNQ